MNTLPPAPPAVTSKRSLVLRVCIVLSFAHAIFVTGGLWLTAAMRSSSEHYDFGKFAEHVWMYALLWWPVWWVICLIARPTSWRRSGTWMLGATVIWLATAIPVILWIWSMRDFR